MWEEQFDSKRLILPNCLRVLLPSASFLVSQTLLSRPRLSVPAMPDSPYPYCIRLPVPLLSLILHLLMPQTPCPVISCFRCPALAGGTGSLPYSGVTTGALRP